MSELTKMRRTEIMIRGIKYRGVPSSALDEIEDKLKKYRAATRDSVPSNEVFKDLDEQYGRSGTIIRGYRFREGLTQEKLAKMIKVDQGDLSKMESGKRPVGKKIAQRLAKVFRTNYRVFL